MRLAVPVLVAILFATPTRAARRIQHSTDNFKLEDKSTEEEDEAPVKQPAVLLAAASKDAGATLDAHDGITAAPQLAQLSQSTRQTQAHRSAVAQISHWGLFKFLCCLSVVMTVLICITVNMCFGNTKGERHARGLSNDRLITAQNASGRLKASLLTCEGGSDVHRGASQPGQSITEQQQLDEIMTTSRRLCRTVQKYPKSGRSMFRKDRYVAVQAKHEERKGPGNKESARPGKAVSHWRRGTLSWWEDEHAFKHGEKARGVVDLMQITKVQTSKDEKTGRTVVIRFNALVREKVEMTASDGSSEASGRAPCELFFFFPSKQDADAWAYSLWSFLDLLRSTRRAADGARLGSVPKSVSSVVSPQPRVEGERGDGASAAADSLGAGIPTERCDD